MKLIATLFTIIILLNNQKVVKTNTPKHANLVDIEITVKNIKTTNGQILIGIFKDNASFDKEKPYKSVQASKASMKNGVLIVKTQLESGIYGASLLDDENNNAKMDYNFIGVPKEGFGFSNYYHKGFTKPKFQSFLFEVKDAVSTKIDMTIRYM
jgi:uncharacterized protein (DUF2141 family)